VTLTLHATADTVSDFDDGRATDFLLRTLVLDLATCVVFVTPRWGFATRKKIVDLIKQLNEHDDPNHHISLARPLTVVHNHPEILSVPKLFGMIEVCNLW
jgi:hypothetical protein